MILEDVIDSIKLKCRQLPYRKDLNPYFKCELNHDDKLVMIILSKVESIIIQHTALNDDFWYDERNESFIQQGRYKELAYQLSKEVVENYRKAAKS